MNKILYRHADSILNAIMKEQLLPSLIVRTEQEDWKCTSLDGSPTDTEADYIYADEDLNIHHATFSFLIMNLSYVIYYIKLKEA